jgi:shikimate kinase
VVIDRQRVRYRSLSSRLAAARAESGNGLSGQVLSEALLFGLDHGLVPPIEVCSLVRKRLPREWLIAIRFAVRVAESGELSLWDHAWRHGTTSLREWLLVSAFDQLGHGAKSLPFDPPISLSSELRKLQDFMEQWAGSSVDRTPPEHEPLTAQQASRVSSPLTIIGFSSSGKSTVVSHLRRSGALAVDADDIAVEMNGPGLDHAFNVLGATTARAMLFSQALNSSYVTSGKHIVAFGASATSLAACRRLLVRNNGVIVCLAASEANTISRLRSNVRHPLHSFCREDYGANQVARVKQIRVDTYYAADYSIDTDGVTTNALCQALGGTLRRMPTPKRTKTG